MTFQVSGDRPRRSRPPGLASDSMGGADGQPDATIADMTVRSAGFSE
jgi:hypothetical protein